MKKTIFNVYVEMTSQEQCDRMKQLCIDNELPVWNSSDAFIKLFENDYFSFIDKVFRLSNEKLFIIDFIKVTEQEFIELLKKYKQNN